MKTKIKTIIFDVGGVLQLPSTLTKPFFNEYLNGLSGCFHKNKGVHSYISSKLKLALDQWFDAIDSVYVRSVEGAITEKHLTKTISSNLNVPEKKLIKLVIRAYKVSFKLNRKLFSLAKKLKKRGYKTAILSDQWHLSKKALITKKFYKNFKPIILSCEVGIRKPDIKIYKLILKRLGNAPGECVFIDNQKWNLTPAKKCGIKTILFKNNEQTINELRTLGVEV